MAYTHTQYEVMLTNNAVITSTGDKATWGPGYIPHVLRAWSFVITTSPTTTAPVLAMDKQPSAGSATGRIASYVSPLKPAIGQAVGSVVYKDGIQAKINPGEQLVFNITTASAAGAGSAIMFVEPTWETPGNNTNMALTT